MVYCYSCGSTDVEYTERRLSERQDNDMCDDCFRKILTRHAKNKIVEVNKAEIYVGESNKLERLEIDIEIKHTTVNNLIASNGKLKARLCSMYGDTVTYTAKPLKERNVYRNKRDRHPGMGWSALVERHTNIMDIVHGLDRNFKTTCMVPANHHAKVVQLRTIRNNISACIRDEQAYATMLQQQIEKCELRDEKYMAGTGSLFLEAKEHFDEVQSSS